MTIDDIALTLHPDLGIRTAIHLIGCFGSAGAVYGASADELVARAQIRPALARSLAARECHGAAEAELEFAARNRIRVLAVHDEAYPSMLRECADYPHVIYVKGDADLNAGHRLSVVGTRRATPYGLAMCDRLVEELARRFADLVVVSGLAYGIDIAAHRAALKHGVGTLAVLGHPLTHIYPSPHTDSARSIVERGGALISEYPSGAHPDRAGFVQRNRIIAGLSDGTVIVESADRGGSLITADMAFGYDREVMAVPGRVGDRYAEGTNRLIRTQKAEIVCSGADIAETLRWESPAALAPEASAVQRALDFGSSDGALPPAAFSGDKKERIFALMEGEPVSLDELSGRSGIAPEEIAGLLLELEFSGLVLALPGNLYLKA